MRHGWVVAAAFLIASTGAVLGADRPLIGGALEGLRSADPVVVERSIDALREAGPAGLKALLTEYDAHPDPALVAEIDAVAGQRDALWSRLYWYTDPEKAKAAAAAEHKPILYLRLLGKLTDEYSCANSRFFRTVLYANKGVSDLLRERFVLVWVSERPVPVVTVDYGDGRVLKRTLTGNSAHYVLDPQGRVVDVLPGLFDPATFSRMLSAAADAVASGSDQGRTQRLERVGVTPGADLGARTPMFRQEARSLLSPNAAEAGARAMSKLGPERPLLRATSRDLAATMDRLDGVAAPRTEGVAKLDDRSIAMIRSQDPERYADPTALERTVRHFEETIAADTASNIQLRSRALRWLAESPAIPLEELNGRVYAELFLTPATDPWLGLRPENTYSALTNDGCSVSPPR